MKLGLILESPTSQASSDWAAKLGYSLDRLPNVQRRSIMLMEEFRALLDLDGLTTVISGNLGPEAMATFHPP